MQAARDWSLAVWEAARAAGPRTIREAELETGLALARRPVFICGAHRSGTTLVRDLLDDHPALSVLPAEGTYHTNLAPTLAARPRGAWLATVASEWLRRLANPINRPPYWLLGRSGPTASPYVEFARTLIAWWPAVESHLGPTHPSWPLVAVSMGYASASRRLASHELAKWVEKTPANERFLTALEREFPDAVIVHVVRHPFAVIASRKQLEVEATGRFDQFSRAVDDLAVSFDVAAARPADAPGYCRVHYEDLVRDARGVTARLAERLEIAWSPSLLEPTVAGQPASSNTSDGAPSQRGHILMASARESLLTARERARIAAAVGDAARALGYDLDRANTARLREAGGPPPFARQP
jgi:hypothetical protein